MEGMNPAAQIAARSSGRAGPSSMIGLNGDRAAQLQRFAQIRDAEEIDLLAQGVSDLDHAMAVAIRLDHREHGSRGTDSFPRDARVVTQSGAIDFRPATILA